MARAVKLFYDEVVSVGKATTLAGVPQGEFIDHLGALNIPVDRFGKNELNRESPAFR